jgi:hypothetical protein
MTLEGAVSDHEAAGWVEVAIDGEPDLTEWVGRI